MAGLRRVGQALASRAGRVTLVSLSLRDSDIVSPSWLLAGVAVDSAGGDVSLLR